MRNLIIGTKMWGHGKSLGVNCTRKRVPPAPHTSTGRKLVSCLRGLAWFPRSRNGDKGGGRGARQHGGRRGCEQTCLASILGSMDTGTRRGRTLRGMGEGGCWHLELGLSLPGSQHSCWGKALPDFKHIPHLLPLAGSPHQTPVPKKHSSAPSPVQRREQHPLWEPGLQVSTAHLTCSRLPSISRVLTHLPSP